MKLHSKHSFVQFFPQRLIAAAAISLCASYAHATDSFTIKDIRVEGVQRVDAGTVFNYLPMHVGDTFTDAKATDAIKALYGTGFFKDVSIETQGDVLVVHIDERPAIASVDFIGIKEFKKEQLKDALKNVGIAESRIFDRSLVARAEQELKNQYLSRGLYGAKVTTTITPMDRNRVAIAFSVDEGSVSKIKKISFVGNKVFSDSDLLDQLKLSTSGWFSWYTKSDQYSKQKLSTDIESLRSFYLDRGYLQMQIESTQVSISPDKKDIFVTINLKEGDKYTVSDISVSGETLGMHDELLNLVSLKAGDVYNGKELTDSTKRITDRLGNFGYAFAHANVNPIVDEKNKTVKLDILVDPGKRTYVRQVNISGNNKTRDEVIRREFRQYENSWYDGEKIKLSRDRVDRLGYFSNVNVDTPEVAGSDDQVDVNMRVEEKPTGNITLGAGFSQEDKLSLTGGISQENVFGSGNTLSLNVNTSKRYRTISISQTDPYFTDDGVSRTYDLYTRTMRPSVYATADYRVRTNGGSVSFGVPFSEVDRVFFGIGLEDTQVDTYGTSPTLYQQFVRDNSNNSSGIGKARGLGVPLTVSWQRDSRDSALAPTEGRYQRANLEVSPFADLNYYKASYQHQYFKPLWDGKVILALNGEIDYGHGLGSKPFPVFKNYYAGGIGSVRGFEGGSLGANKDQYGDSMGGASRLLGSAEFQFAFPGAGQDRTLRWFTFFDAGQVYAEGKPMQLSELRFSTGIGLSWLSPIGPLKISFGKPLNAKPTDTKQAFQFQIGTGF